MGTREPLQISRRGIIIPVFRMESGTALWMIDEHRKETRGKESRKKVIPGGQARDGEGLYVSSEPAGTEK